LLGDKNHKIPLNSIGSYIQVFFPEIVSDILARVSDKNPPNIYEETPLHRAAKNGHDRCIEGGRVLQFWILEKVNPDFIARYFTIQTPN
jgi:ankyrin repeat protein